MMDFIDNLYGRLNLIEWIFGFVNQSISPSKDGKYGELVRIRIQRVSKGGKLPFLTLTAHLHKHGVPTFYHAYDANYRYLSVRKSQATWAHWLYNNGNPRTPKRAWKDK